MSNSEYFRRWQDQHPELFGVRASEFRKGVAAFRKSEFPGAADNSDRDPVRMRRAEFQRLFVARVFKFDAEVSDGRANRDNAGVAPPAGMTNDTGNRNVQPTSGEKFVSSMDLRKRV